MTITVAGLPQCFVESITRIPRRIECHSGKELTIQNLGPNTLYLSLDSGRTEMFVSCGTSFDLRFEFEDVLMRTKLGETTVQGIVTS